jgi:purine catabolism regulator
MERIAAPIIVYGENLGYVWIISGDRPLGELEWRAIEQAATAAALIMLKDKEVKAVEQRMQEDFICRLVSGAEADAPMLVHEAKHLGLDVECPHQIVLLQFDTPPSARLSILSHRLDRVVKHYSRSTFITWRGDHLVAICEGRNRKGGIALVRQLIKELDSMDVLARAGVGRTYDSLAGMHVSYQQAWDALRIGRIFNPEKKIFEFDNLGLLYWLDQLSSDVLPLNIYAEHVRALAEADEDQRMDLLPTLELYLDTGGRVKEAAQKLFIHRNTLYHRLDRIQSICNLDIKDPLVRLNLHVALKFHRLRTSL